MFQPFQVFQVQTVENWVVIKIWSNKKTWEIAEIRNFFIKSGHISGQNRIQGRIDREALIFSWCSLPLIKPESGRILARFRSWLNGHTCLNRISKFNRVRSNAIKYTLAYETIKQVPSNFWQQWACNIQLEHSPINCNPSL